MRATWAIGWLVIGVLAFGCGGDDRDRGSSASTSPSTGKDGGGGDGDSSGDGDGDGDSAVIPEPVCTAPDGIVGGCGVCADRIYELAMTDDTPRGLPLGMNRIKSRAGFVFIGDSAGCAEGVKVADIDGDAFKLEQPVAQDAVRSCHLFNEPAIAWAADEAWLLAFVSNEDGNHVRTQVFDAHGDLSNDGFRVGDGAIQPANVAVAIAGDNRRIVVWTEGGGPGADTTVMARPVDATGEPTGPAQTVISSPHGVGSLAVAQLGKVGDELPPPGAVITMWRLSDEASEIIVIPIDLDGAPAGAERIVRSDVGDKANVAATLNDRQVFGEDVTAAAIAYTVSQGGGNQMWFEMLDANAELGPLLNNEGQIAGPSAPRRVINSPKRATGVSIARYAQGYIVVYRALQGGLVQEPKIRAVFLNDTGEFIVDSDIAFASEFGGPTAVVTGSDGRMFAAWSEVDPTDGSAVYRVVRLPCP